MLLLSPNTQLCARAAAGLAATGWQLGWPFVAAFRCQPRMPASHLVPLRRVGLPVAAQSLALLAVLQVLRRRQSLPLPPQKMWPPAESAGALLLHIMSRFETAQPPLPQATACRHDCIPLTEASTRALTERGGTLGLMLSVAIVPSHLLLLIVGASSGMAVRSHERCHVAGAGGCCSPPPPGHYYKGT